jgi:hypothetical protein
MSDIDIIENISAKKAIEEILGAAKTWYLSEINGSLIHKRGVFFEKIEMHSHKWQENGKKFNFCVKCGAPKDIEKYYSHGCPVSAKQYNSFPYPKHTYEVVEIKSIQRPVRVLGQGYRRQNPKLYRLKICRKCGIIESREKVFFKLDKETGDAYEVNGPVGAKTKHIHCSLTDDEYDIRDIII